MGFWKRVELKRKIRRHVIRSIQPWDVVDECSLQCLEEWFSSCSYLEVYMGKASWDNVFGGTTPASTTAAVEDPAMAEMYPTLCMMMTETPVLSGKKRQTCTLALVAEDGMFKAGLRDRDRMMSIWVSSPTWEGLWDALESALTQEPPPWRKIDPKYAKPRDR